MALSVSLCCDVCGHTTEPTLCTDRAARTAIAGHRAAKGWRRVFWEGRHLDYCPSCVRKNLPPFVPGTLMSRLAVYS